MTEPTWEQKLATGRRRHAIALAIEDAAKELAVRTRIMAQPGSCIDTPPEWYVATIAALVRDFEAIKP